jgi:hypothetical protein
VSLAEFRPLSSMAVCGATVGPRPPDLGYRLTTPTTTVHATSAPAYWFVTLPVRLHNDSSHALIGYTSHTPWTAVTTADGLIVAVTTVMRASANGVSLPPGGVRDGEAFVPLNLCRERPLNAPREFLGAGTYQIWVDIDIDIDPGSDLDGGKVTVRGGPFALVVDRSTAE